MTHMGNYNPGHRNHCAMDEDEDEPTSAEQVQLGYVEDLTHPCLHEIQDWSSWDGGIVGGRPVRTGCITLVCMLMDVCRFAYVCVVAAYLAGK
jgi:hypothetical protein